MSSVGAGTGGPAATGPASYDSLRRRAVVAGVVGTAVEWFDFFLYGTAAALVFGRVFFPGFSPGLGTLAAFGAFASGFVARPIGGALFAHFGDRRGRKPVLIWTLALMGAATAGIGLLPGYGTLGVGAPILLVGLRILQGLGVGGEWGGAALMAVETAPSGRRGLYASGPQAGVPIGVIAGTGSFLLLDLVLSDAQFTSWGWRLPFLLGGVLAAVGLWIRVATRETTVFADHLGANRAARAPVFEVLRDHPRAVLVAAGIFVATNSVSYLQSVWVVAYATTTVGFTRSEALGASILWSLGTIPLAVACGWLSDRRGRRTLAMLGTGGLAVVSVPYVVLVDSGSFPLLVLAGLLLQVWASAVYGPMPATFAELFPTRVRYSGISVAYQLAAVVGGLAPAVGAALVIATGTALSVGVFLGILALVSFGCSWSLTETAAADLPG